MSPILMRPVREQLEHDRVIEVLQGRWRRRYEVAINVGTDQSATVKAAGTLVSPDLVLSAAKGGRRLEGIVEVETAESVNHLEAMAQWANFAKVRAPFYLYVPAGTADVARRLCAAHDIRFAEIWSYHTVGDNVRFAMVHRRPPGRAHSARAKAGAAGRSTRGTKAARSSTTTRKSTARKSSGRTAASRTTRRSSTGTARKATKAGARTTRTAARKSSTTTARGRTSRTRTTGAKKK